MIGFDDRSGEEPEGRENEAARERESRERDSRGPADPSAPEDRRPPPLAEEIRSEIANEIVRIHEESYGTTARNPDVVVHGDWVIVILDDLELLPNEQFLVDSGRGDVVTQVRRQYQEAIQSTFSAAVERATGRTVVGFISGTSVDEPRFVTEIFKLG